MKPKTKIQFAVVELCEHLPELSQDQIDYAENKFFPKLAYATKSSGFCLECGESIDLKKIVGNTVVCDHCGETLKVEHTLKRTLDAVNYRFSISDLVQFGIYDFQIIRTFEFCNYYKKGRKKKTYNSEVCRNFYDISGKEVHYSKLCSYYGTFQGLLELRKCTTSRGGYGYYRNNYNIAADLHYPESNLRPEYIQKGIDHNILCGISLKMLIDDLKFSEVETIIKAGYEKVYKYFGAKNICKYFSSLKICIRNKYKISDPGIYFDLLVALEKLGLDLKNAHYVCPLDLHKAHNYYIDKAASTEEKRQIANREKMEAEEKAKALRVKNFTEKTFKKEKEMFFDLQFSKNKIVIEPLTSIKEFEKEGTELKHCIYKNKYYLKENTLLFSAKVKGKRTETIEFDLNQSVLLQCRGYDNKDSKYHKDIMNFFKTKIPLIRKRIQSGIKKA